ncbi:telomerase-binding protein EST1A isoform X2 [Plodia interpunctella]|uniref:telomerase-binding protein EST1A isoform X2 n=1 Tax=Plodia interpunctella TaxID=58824 RepID=UPI00236890B9|nr:telomerase-binding protein EST1A isoform X2 [Plodia interpunctella]
MDDDSKEYRRNKPQQKLYKPGSGPLRRSSYGLDAKMDHYGSQNSIQDETVSNASRDNSIPNSRPKKPEQQLYVPRLGDLNLDDRQVKSRGDNSSHSNNKKMSSRQDKQNVNSGSSSYPRSGSRRGRTVENHYKDSGSNDVNYNRNYRQVSETRSISPSHIQERNHVDRNRDSRSMESSAARYYTGGGGKPPSGRRNSGGYSSDSSRPKFMGNIDNIPPRFRKKFLEQSGHHSFDSVDQINRHASNQSLQPNYNQSHVYNSNLNWSQTLPSRGRGRLREEGLDSEKFINSYLKSYEVQNSGRSTPSSSYVNIYESSILDNKHERNNIMTRSDNQKECYGSTMKNGLNDSGDVLYNNEPSKESQHESDTISQITNSLLDMTNLDWTEEVEKNIKLDDMCDSSTSFSQTFKSSASQEIKQAIAQENKPAVSQENKHGESKRRSRRSNKRSSSRGQRNSEKKERNRRDSNASIQLESERNRKDSNVSMQHETIFSNLKQRERERRDSHKSNRSSTIGNSRDDLDRWRSLRSYSREQSAEGRIVSQCNSRDPSANRATSPRDNDGFRIPASKSTTWTSTNQKKSNGSWAGGRTPSVERGRQSPAPISVEPAAGGAGDAAAGGRRARKGGRRRGRHSELAHHPLPTTNSSSSTNWREEILESKKHSTHERHPETPSQRTRVNSTMSDKSVSESTMSHPGLIVLPQSSISHLQKDQGRGASVETQKTLYDHQNPSKPIIVQTSPNKVDIRMDRGGCAGRWRGEAAVAGVAGDAGDAGDAARAVRHRDLLQRVDRADAILQTHALRGPMALAAHWPDVADTRKFLQNALHRLLMSDLKYCQADNIEHHFWKILYYNFIEVLRKSFTQIAPENKPEIVKLINVIIEEGNIFFESLVQALETTYKFNIDDYINDNHVLPPKGLGYVGLALISVQKLYVFLGDLARYKEQVNETNNYAKSKYWYTKAQQINPKNGRPYNQLAILAIYARRKLDAVYYYMRSLMSSNPFHSARESLISLFDENRKKYEAAERKRRAAAETTRSAENGETGHGAHSGCGLRREVWVRPSGHRTTTLRPHNRDEDFASMTSVELNKSFITSYLHVHGKLITKIGMETFHESASLMLRQFRALLTRQPLPTPAPRLLQLTALNMFAVETTHSQKDGSIKGSRSAWLECALGVSLLMFGVMLERCCTLLPEPAHAQQHTDALLLLPAIKVWSDWMLCHSSVWNPPPAFNNFEIETDNDPWDWLAKLMNILENLDEKSIELEYEPKEGYLPVRLAEDTSLGGFTPLMYMEPATAWLRSDPTASLQTAEHALRTRKLLFFGTEYLVGVEPPVLRLEYPGDAPPRYVSAVQRLQPNHPPLQHLSEDSEDEDSASGATSGPTSLSESLGGPDEAPDEATRRLLRRKEQLESRKANLEKRRERMQEMLRGGWVSVEVEVRPRWLVPDTNCFIDHLPLLAAVEAAQPYVLAVPLVVMTELEGLKKCSRVGASAQAALSWVASASAANTARVRLATSRGSLLASCSFTAEREQQRATNDDRVLATAVNLQANLPTQTESPREEASDVKCVKRVREVVLLTDDRNLRVKALAAELPARDLPSFVQWAGLAQDANMTTISTKKKHSVNK